MTRQTFNLVRIVLDPRVTAAPRRVLRTLRARGIRRLPEEIEVDVQRGGPPSARVLRFIRQWLDGELLSRHRGQWVINSFMPPFPGPAFDRMFENLLSGRHLSPVSAFLAVTQACPYRCWHCSLQARKAGHLPTETWQDVIRQLHGLGVSLVGFTGGEPLARPDLPALVRAAAAGGAATIVFTSGARLDAERAAALRRAGLWALCVSLDHPVPEECDRLRGVAGAFDQAVAALRLSVRRGFYTMMATVATRAVIEEQRHRALYALARRLGVHEYRLVEPMPCGKLAAAPDDVLLTPDHVKTLRAFHVETNRRGRLPKVCAFNQVESPEIFGCGAGTQHLFVDAAGEVCPCDFTPLSFGNVTQTPLADLWRRMNLALGDNPRCDCFIQKYHRLVAAHAGAGWPLPPEVSERICAQIEKEPLPGYFALVSRAGRNP